MNANELLKQDHRLVEKLYAEFTSKESDLARKEDLAREILTELTLHALIEEELFYPELVSMGEIELTEEFKTEHDEVKTMIGKLTLLDISDPQFDIIMNSMMSAFTMHSREEEEEAMPEMEEILGKERLLEIGKEIEARREELRESTIKRLWSELTH
jgi:hemerythrin superfamily protein